MDVRVAKVSDKDGFSIQVTTFMKEVFHNGAEIPRSRLGFHSSAIEDVDHGGLWLALLSEFRRPGAHAPWFLVKAIESVEFEIDIFARL